MYLSAVLECRPGWILIDGLCIVLHTEYSFTNDTDDVEPVAMTMDDVTRTCMQIGGEIATDASSLSGVHISRLTTYLNVWNHTERYGSILLRRNDDTCTLLKVPALYSCMYSYTFVRLFECDFLTFIKSKYCCLVAQVKSSDDPTVEMSYNMTVAACDETTQPFSSVLCTAAPTGKPCARAHAHDRGLTVHRYRQSRPIF